MKEPARELAVQVHLEEFSALREEMLEIIKWRENLVFFSLAISGALFSFSFSIQPQNNVDMMSPRLALYLIAPLAALIGGLWMVNTWRIHRMGLYIRDVIATRLNEILKEYSSDLPIGTGAEVFAWQSSSHRILYKWPRRVFEWMVLLTTFILSGITAQLILLKNTSGSIIQRIAQLDFPPFYVANWLLIAIIFLVLLNHLLKGRQQRSSSIIVRQ